MTTTQEAPTSPSITWGYRRKSSLQQSYERQTKALHDLGIPEERIFEDAMSGITMNRPGWQNLLSHVRANDVVWVDGLDRLGRSTLVTLQAMEELEQRGVRVRSAKPGEDLQGATGELKIPAVISASDPSPPAPPSDALAAEWVDTILDARPRGASRRVAPSTARSIGDVIRSAGGDPTPASESRHARSRWLTADNHW